MAEFRTKLQIEADRLDLQIYNLTYALDKFANEHRLADVHEYSAVIDGMRHRVRRHMHQKDAEATNG